MALHAVDLTIVIAYLAATLLIGFWVSKRASTGLKSYFLGGNKLPWYALGLSNASGMFDVAGTMWLVSILFVYGLKSIWLPWLWPVFNQIFLMVFLSIWLRRSGAADRRGMDHLQVRRRSAPRDSATSASSCSRSSWCSRTWPTASSASASSPRNSCRGILAQLLQLDVLPAGRIAQRRARRSARGCALCPTSTTGPMACVIVALTALYTIRGGMYSVVFTEVMQFGVMTVTCIAIA